MFRQLLPVSALLLGSACLLFAGGVNSLILPVRGAAEGFSSLSLGLLGTGWALGYVIGCIATPRLVARVGHIRAFSVMASIAALSILGSLLVISPFAWIPLRSLSGFCFAGAAMIVESWLSEQADSSSRGRVFGVYTMINLAASTLGQLTLTLGDSAGFLFFVLGAMFYCLALVPTAAFSTTTPRPLVRVNLDIPALWRNSPVAVFGVLMVGVSNSSFGTLAAVYAGRVGLDLTTIAFFASIPILAGAVSQVPIGALSDRMDRRRVLLGVVMVAIIADLAFILLEPQGVWLNLGFAALFGAMIFAMYPVIIAHANDHAEEGTFIQTSGGLLLVFGIGSIIGPLIAGVAMSAAGPTGLFVTTLAGHWALAAFTLWRIMQRKAVARDDKSSYVTAPAARLSTPETAAFAARQGLAGQGEEDAAEDATEALEAAEAAQAAQATPPDPREPTP